MGKGIGIGKSHPSQNNNSGSQPCLYSWTDLSRFLFCFVLKLLLTPINPSLMICPNYYLPYTFFHQAAPDSVVQMLLSFGSDSKKQFKKQFILHSMIS